MSTRLKKKTAILVATIVVCMVAMGFLLSGMQERLSISNCDTEISQEAAKLPELLQDAADETTQNTQTFDAIYQSKADSVAFMANNNAGYAATNAKMAEYKQLLEVDNIMIVRADGTVVAAAGQTQADFSQQRFNQLRSCLTSGKASEAVEVELTDKNWLDRYYASKIDDDTMVVIEQNPSELRELIASTGSTESVLKNISIGSHGFVMSVSSKDYLVGYHPDSSLIGTDVTGAGIDVANLSDGAHFSCTFGGQKLYCGVSQIDDAYYVFCVPESDFVTSRTITVGVILFVFLAVMVAVALYGIFVMREDERTGTGEKFRAFGGYHYNRSIGKKAIVLSICGFLVVLGVSFYMQTLFALSSQSVTNNERASQISETIERSDERMATLKSQYSTRYLSKCRVAAYIVDANPSLATKDKMYELASVLQIAAVYVLDGNGDMIASSTPLRSYSLSTDPNESSYAFRALLGGKEELVQAVSTNDSTGEAQQFIGVATHDSAGYANGLVQIAVRPTRLETLINSVKIENVLDGVKVGASGFAFAVNKSSQTVAYFPNESLEGKTATEVGISADQLRDGRSDYLKVNGQTYFATCKEVDGYYLFVAGNEGELMSERGPLTVATGIIAALCLAFIFIVLSLERSVGVGAAVAGAAGAAAATGVAAAARREEADDRVIDVQMADGTTKRSESAMSRWLNKSLNWHEKSPEQKLGTTIRWFIGIAAFIVCFAVLFKDSIFPENSVIAYILAGDWERGFNIFACTASIMYACVAITVATVLQWLLHMLAGVLGARGETVCRLLSSIVKYGMVIFMLYWCLGVLGVDTATLLASAGIITLAISFGAKDLITDILCGLFIIFEGEFRVGDVIQVGSNTGTVMDIGVRTTKIKNGSGDVLVLRNSGVSNVVNKTKLDSYANVDVILPTGESLTYLENVLADELPKVRRRVPDIIDGPFYKGVVDLTDSTMTIRVVATCSEGDRGALERTLKREMKLLLTRNDIAPFVKEYDHEVEEKTVEEKLAEAAELRAADRFTAQQEDAAEKVGNDEAGAGSAGAVPPPPA
jgi:moderate conductance mechanosensitive channel